MLLLRFAGLFLALLILIYLIGPQPRTPRFDKELVQISYSLAELDTHINNKESRLDIKPGNEANIIWYDGKMEVTDYCMVYLHGFSASPMEGAPVHQVLATNYGMNLYLPRLDGHGLNVKEPLQHMTAVSLWNSAREAFAVGKKLGKKVILVSTSTGGTLALKLAATYPEIAGLILLSPNIEIRDPNAWLLNNPWGLQIARLVKNSAYNYARDTSATYARYWYPHYRLEAAVQLQELIERTMKGSTFEKVTQPALVLYYYKNEEEQDQVVDVKAIKRMFGQLGTDTSLKRAIALPNTGDHVIGSSIKSKDVGSVIRVCEEFLEQVMNLIPADSTKRISLPGISPGSAPR